MVGKFRRTLRHSVGMIARPFAMVAVVGILAVGLVAGGSNQAWADAAVIDALPEILGDTEVALPEVMAVEAEAGPLGWGPLAGTAGLYLGLTIYQNRDTWGPWVAGMFGQSQPKTDGQQGSLSTYQPSAPTSGPTPGAGYLTSAPLTFSNLQTVSSGGRKDAQVTVTYSGSSSSTLYPFVEFHIYCQKPDGTTYMQSKSSNYGNVRSGGTTVNALTATGVCNTATSTADVVNGLWAGPESLTQFDDDYPGSYPPASYDVTVPSTTTIEIGQQGNPSPSFDPKSPTQTYTTTVECIAPDGTKVNLSKNWTGDSPGMVYPSCAAAGLGHGDGGLTVTSKDPNTGQTVNLLTRAPIAPDTNHPLCGANMPGDGCKLQVLVDGKPCTIGNWDCANWTRIDQSRVSCFYGPYAMPISECSPLERAYESEAGVPATQENTDGNPSTANDKNLNGQPNPAPNSLGTVPGGAASGNPLATMPGATTDEQQCFPNGWSMFNPAEWVLKPIGCALQSAFVPKTQTVQDTSTKIQNTINTVGFGAVTTAWVNTFNQVGGGSGCAGPSVVFNFGGVSQTLQPFNACSEPMSTVAAITYAFSSIIIVLAGGLGMARAISSGFGFNFSLGRGSSE